MAEYFKYLRDILAIAGESFEDELRRLVSHFKLDLVILIYIQKKPKSPNTDSSLFLQGFSVTSLNPIEVLSALIQAQRQIGREFSAEEFKSGSVGQHLKPEDFKTSEQVLNNYAPLLTSLRLTSSQ